MEIAGCVVEVRPMFETTRHYCADYLTEKPADYTVTVTREDLRFEQDFAFREAEQEGLRPRVFTDPFLERQAIRRKASLVLLERRVLLMHGSAVAVDGEGYLFTGPCRTGKSTHTRLWCREFGDRAQMVNDDMPFLRLLPEGVMLCGSPWGGKHGIQNNITVPLRGICVLQRGTQNRIRRMEPEEGLPVLLHQGGAPEDARCQSLYEELVGELARRVSLWQLHCTKDPEAALVASGAMHHSL